MSQEFVTQNIIQLKPYQPGKPIEEVEREYGVTDIIKLASNENPLGPSPAAVEAMRQALTTVNLYPDGACFYLKRDLAKHLDIPEDCLVFGNGSDELIHYIGVTFLQPGDEVLQGDVTFVRYESAATLGQCACIMVPLKELTYDLEAMAERISPKTRLVFIANPNNPTGTIVTARQQSTLLIPLRAVETLDGKAYVQRVVGGKAERIEVTLGLMNDTDAEITGGLAEGDEVALIPVPETTTQQQGGLFRGMFGGLR